MRREFVMSQEQLDTLLNACKPTPCMFLSGGQRMGSTPQENANAAWRELGEVMGFKGDTVQPIAGAGQKRFTAEELGETDDDRA